MSDELKKLMTPKMDAKEAYTRGYDCGLHGTSEANSHFAIFQSEEMTAAWSEGKNDAKAGKPNKYAKQ